MMFVGTVGATAAAIGGVLPGIAIAGGVLAAAVLINHAADIYGRFCDQQQPPPTPIPNNPSDSSPLTEAPSPLPGTVAGFDAWWAANAGSGVSISFGISTSDCITVTTCVQGFRPGR